MEGQKYYLTDLNPTTWYGLNHELWCLVDGLMICNETGRNLMTRGFYPDYNSKFTVDLNIIIDITETNKKLKENGFSCKIAPFDETVIWERSKYSNPVYNSNFCNLQGRDRFFKMTSALKEEKGDYLDLFTTFVWPLMHPYDYDKELTERAIKLFLCLCPSALIKLCVEKRKEQLNLSEKYDAVHLRIEDDWMNHLTIHYKHNPHFGKTFEACSNDIFRQVVDKIRLQFSDQNPTFIATGLIKTENVNNSKISELKTQFGEKRIIVGIKKMCNWEKIFPSVGCAREIEGFIDFLICLNSEKAIVSSHSSFSVCLKYLRDYQKKETFVYNG